MNPLALRDRLAILWENKRYITEIETEQLGPRVDAGNRGDQCGQCASYVCAHAVVEKGEEKGYFAFGGSATLTLFEPGRCIGGGFA